MMYKKNIPLSKTNIQENKNITHNNTELLNKVFKSIQEKRDFASTA